MNNGLGLIDPAGITLLPDGSLAFKNHSLEAKSIQLAEGAHPDLAPNKPNCNNEAQCGLNQLACTNTGNCTGTTNTYFCSNRFFCKWSNDLSFCTGGGNDGCPKP